MASVAAPGPTATGFLAALDEAERSDLLRRGRRRRYRRGAPVFHEGGGSARIYIDPSASAQQKKTVEELCSAKHGGGVFEIFPKTFSKVFPTKSAKIEWSFKGYDSRFAVDGLGEVKSSHILNPVTNDPFEGQVLLPGGIGFKKAEVTSVDWWLKDAEAMWNMSHRKANGHVTTVTFNEKGPA